MALTPLVALPPPHAGAAAATPRRQLTVAAASQNQVANGKELSGSDVLMALARAKKLKERERERGAAPRRKDNDAVTAAANQPASHIKPLFINPQWTHQLHQLETRLYHLPHA